MGSNARSAALGWFKLSAPADEMSISTTQLPHLPRPPQMDLIPTPPFHAAASNCSPWRTSTVRKSGKKLMRGKGITVWVKPTRKPRCAYLYGPYFLIALDIASTFSVLQ